MKKKLIVAVATALVLANGASAAFADTGSESGSSTTSTTIAGGSENSRLTDAQKEAFEAERDAYRAKLQAIHETGRTALRDAEKAFLTALVSATTDAARASAQVTFRAAGVAALQKYQDSIVALGLPPVRPVLTDEQKDQRKEERKDERKAEKEAFKVKRVAILETFRNAVEGARDTFKAAKESATTDDAKKAAESAFKTAVSTATQIKTDALKALGFKPSNSGKSDSDK